MNKKILNSLSPHQSYPLSISLLLQHSGESKVTRGTQAPYLSKSMNTLSFPPKEKGGRRTEGRRRGRSKGDELPIYLLVGFT